MTDRAIYTFLITTFVVAFVMFAMGMSYGIHRGNWPEDERTVEACGENMESAFNDVVNTIHSSHPRHLTVTFNYVCD